MALTRTRLRSSDLVLRAEETSERESLEHTIRAVTPSAFPTTASFTEANVSVAMVALMAIPEDGDARGLGRQIKSVSSTTATIDAAWPATSGVTRIRLWKLPDLPAVATAADGSAPYDVVAGNHAGLTNEPDGYWASGDWMLIGVGGANNGRAAKITGFTQSTGTFVVEAGIFTNISIGDRFDIRQMLSLEADIEVSLEQGVLKRASIGAGEREADIPIPTNVTGSVSMVLAAKSMSTPAASGVQAGRPLNLWSMLGDYFTWRRDTGGTVVSANASIVNLGSSVLTQGGFLLLNTGEAIQIYATDTDGVAPGTQDVAAYGAGHLNHAAVTVGSIAHAAAWCSRKTGDFRSCLLDIYLGGMERFLLPACMAKVTATLNREDLLKFAFEYMVPEGWNYMLDRPVAVGATAPLQIHDLTIPTDAKGTRVKIGSISADITNLTVNFGLTPQLRGGLTGVNQSQGCYIDPEPDQTLAFRAWVDNNDKSGGVTFPDMIRRRKHANLLIQKGSAAGETQVFGVPAAYFTKVTPVVDGGQDAYDCEVTCVPPAKAFGSNTYRNLPALAYGQL